MEQFFRLPFGLTGGRPAVSICLIPLCFSMLAAAQPAIQQNAAKDEFFEKSVRPVLVKSCQMCHNSKAKTSQLDLTTAAGFFTGGASGPVFDREHPEQSHILKAIGYEESLKMPPMGKLKADEISAITEWVKMGAPWPGGESAATIATAAKSGPSFTAEQKSYWAFQPLKEANPPAVKDSSWAHGNLDRFVLAKLEEKGLKPASPANKTALLRRVTFDLTGLPPTPAEIQAFLKDNSPDAFAKVVDRLLASPHYGERWGRHWLDVARYADSTGNDEDHRYPYAWRYRDYVIESFNRDIPYDQFIREQIAGDLLPASDGQSPNRRGIVATGFLALGAKALAQQDKKKMLYDIYDEQVDVTSKAFLGLTMACARCHNHKFDPILTKDYYAFVSMFASTRDFENAEAHVSSMLYVPLVSKDKYAVYAAHQDKIDTLKAYIHAIDSQESLRFVRAESGRLGQYMLAARSVYADGKAVPQVASAEHIDEKILQKWVDYLKVGSKAHPQLQAWDAATKETLPSVAQDYQKRFQTHLDDWAKILEKWQSDTLAAKSNPPSAPKYQPDKGLFFYEVFEQGPFSFDDKQTEALRSDSAKSKIEGFQKQLAQLKTSGPPEPDMACAVEEGQKVDQKVFVRGDYNNATDDAPKAFPTILRKPDDPSIKTTSGRLELSEWIANPKNPLTARVMVNRIWGWHFGDGIVRTSDNFGKMGDRPSNPELLDFLARSFIQSGWSVKKMQRMILLSNTYQMSSDTDERTMEADPENRLMTRFNRQRLDVEQIRDGVLALDGTLDPTMGGTLQKGTGTDSENSSDRLSLDPLKLKRRTVYIPLRRANLPTLLNLFDFGDATTVNGKRTLTNVAPQALFAMNSEFGFEHARNLAENLLAMKAANNSARIQSAYLRILDRAPSPDEADAALTYMEKYAGKYGGKTPELAAWESFCHILLSSNEFFYLD